MGYRAQSFESGTHAANILAGGGGGDGVSTIILAGGGTAKYDNTVAMHGSQCAKLTAATVGDQTVLEWTGMTGSASLVQHFSLRFAAAPSNATDIATIRAAANLAKAQVTSGRLLRVTDAAGTVIKTFGALSLDTWYRVELSATKGTTTSNGRIQCAYYAGDSLTPVEAAYDSGTTVNAGTADPTVARVGHITNTTTGDWFIDSWAAGTQAGFLGPWDGSTFLRSGGQWIPRTITARINNSWA